MNRQTRDLVGWLSATELLSRSLLARTMYAISIWIVI